jgi:type VI secretion system protein
MAEQRLLERISNWEQGAARTVLPRQEMLTKSIVNYLQRILNTRQGTVLLDDQFGVPDFTNGAGASLISGSATDISLAIERMVLKYEPRLSNVDVNIDSMDPLGVGIAFSINANIRADDRQLKTNLIVRLGNNGKITISN